MYISNWFAFFFDSPSVKILEDCMTQTGTRKWSGSQLYVVWIVIYFRTFSRCPYAAHTNGEMKMVFDRDSNSVAKKVFLDWLTYNVEK